VASYAEVEVLEVVHILYNNLAMPKLTRIDDKDRGKTMFRCPEPNCGWESEWMPIHQALEPYHECKQPKEINPVFS
jgi:hypothetical protein